MLEILNYLPLEAKTLITAQNIETLEEIRIRAEKPIILNHTGSETIIPYTPTQQELQKILQFICDNSIYSYQNQICAGYITIKRRP